MRNYAEAAKSVGFSITNSHRNDDDDIFATMTRDGSEYWFKIWGPIYVLDPIERVC
jgi:hypothetical protein